MKFADLLVDLVIGAVITAIALCAGYYGGTVGAAALTTALVCLALVLRFSPGPVDDVDNTITAFISSYSVTIITLTWMASTIK